METIYHISGFLICGVIIFFAGRKLSYYGDILATKTGLGKAWIGLLLMATVTSLPELMAGISSVSVVNDPELAVGNILGGCALNLGMLSIMDVYMPQKRPLLGAISNSHILAASFGLILLCMVGLGIFWGADTPLVLPGLGITSLGFAMIYILAIKRIYEYQIMVTPAATKSAETTEPDVTATLTLRTVVIRYAMYAIIIILTAMALPYFAEFIAEDFNLERSFVGTLFLALCTSLPELAVSIASIQIGSADLAVGNLLGSNIFNVFILFVDDIFYSEGNLLAMVSQVHIQSVFFLLMMTSVAILGIIFPAKEKKIYLSWDTLMLAVLYIFNMFLLYFGVS